MGKSKMDFDQMMESWRKQDDAPLYGVNRDLLQLVLQNEQARIRRVLRRDQWIIYSVGPGMALFAGFWLWVAILRHVPVIQILVAALSSTIFLLWIGAHWLSRRRLTQRERTFGNTLQEEVQRNLSLVDYQIAKSRWKSAILWTAPVMIGASLIYWLTFQINTDTSFSIWHHGFVAFAILWSLLWSAYAGNRVVTRTLEPRRARLSALLDHLNMGD